MKLQDSSSKETIENPIIIESLFRETTRNGKHTIRLALLALTRNLLIIASSHSFGLSTPRSVRNCQSILEIRSLHPLDSLKLTIFKKSERQTLKLSVHNKYDRYFELDKSCGTDELWSNWCKNVIQINKKNVRKKSSKTSLEKSTSYDVGGVFDERWESQKLKWNDKHLYLGSNREIEDKSRPMPVQGLGPPEEIKLLYLKPQYFGCYDQAEHWVQCESSKLLR